MRYIYGYHAIEESVKKYPQGTLLTAPRLCERAEKIKTAALKQGVRIKTADESELKRLSGIADCKGLLYQCKNRKENFPSLAAFFKAIEKREEAVVFILDSVTDPHNFGAVLRSADQFDIDLVITRSRRSSRENKPRQHADGCQPEHRYRRIERKRVLGLRRRPARYAAAACRFIRKSRRCHGKRRQGNQPADGGEMRRNAHRSHCGKYRFAQCQCCRRHFNV